MIIASISHQSIHTGCLKETPYLDISFKRPKHMFEFEIIKIVNMPISLNVMYPKYNLNKWVYLELSGFELLRDFIILYHMTLRLGMK